MLFNRIKITISKCPVRLYTFPTSANKAYNEHYRYLAFGFPLRCLDSAAHRNDSSIYFADVLIMKIRLCRFFPFNITLVIIISIISMARLLLIILLLRCYGTINGLKNLDRNREENDG